MIAQTKIKLTLQEYLMQERQADIKHELIDGEVMPMPGASRKHNLISVNILASLHTQLQERDCEVYSGDMRVGINQVQFYTYPDVVVVCGKPEFYDEEFDTLLNPMVIIEILSPSTASYDRGEKFHRYRQLDSLQDYLLVSQDEIWIEHYVRQSDCVWLLSDIQNHDATIELTSIACNLRVRDIYQKVNIDQPSPGESKEA